MLFFWGMEGKGVGAEQSCSSIWFACGAAWNEREGERGKGSASINSCYITSLCWCQVAERKEKGKRYDLVFQCCPPPPRPTPLPISFLSGFVSMDTDGALCLPSTTEGAPEMRVPLLTLPHPVTLPSIPSLTTMCCFIHNVTPSIMPLSYLLFKCYQNTDGIVIRHHRFCHRVHEVRCRNPTEAANVVRHESFRIQVETQPHMHFWRSHKMKVCCGVCLYCGLPSLCAGFAFVSVTHTIHWSLPSS